MGDLSDAKSELEAWWAKRLPRIGSGHRVQRVLGSQVRRDALEKAHQISATQGLSEDDTTALVAHAVQHCVAPRVKPE